MIARKFISSVTALILLMSMISPIEVRAEEYVEETGYMVSLDEDISVSDEYDKNITQAQAHKAIMAMQEKYPTGTPWDEDKEYVWNGGIFSKVKGCFAFAFMLSDAAFGTAKAIKHFDFNNLMVGDVVAVNKPGQGYDHSFVVLDIYDTYITIAEGNNNDQVKWGRKISLQEIYDRGQYVLTRYPDSEGVKLKSATASLTYKDKNKVRVNMTTNLTDNSELEFSWEVSQGDGNWETLCGWIKGEPEYTWMPEAYGDYVIRGKVRKAGDDSVVLSSDVNVLFREHIKGICQMPYQGAGGGFLIGFETYDNPNGDYRYEMLILDCTLLAKGEDAWIYTTGKCLVPETSFWTIWQPKYGYYWTLFRLYDKDGNLLDESCYGFQNI